MTFSKSTLASALFVVALFFPTAILAENLTDPQENAVRSAKEYLNYQTFSRRGLIQQLSSSAGALRQIEWVGGRMLWSSRALNRS